MTSLLEKAQKWAAKGHLGVSRKFSDLPYIVHPEAVAEIISNITDDEDVIAAAWLHDIVEDTDTTIDEIRDEFNDYIAQLVLEVSKMSNKSMARVERFWTDTKHYGKASKMGKAIKIADSIHNLPLMIRDNPKFAYTYVTEKKILLDYIYDGNPLLASILDRIISDYENGLTDLDFYSKMKKRIMNGKDIIK